MTDYRGVLFIMDDDYALGEGKKELLFENIVQTPVS